MQLSSRLLWTLVAGLPLSVSTLDAQAASLSTDAIINLPAADAWTLFTSDGGLKALGYAQAHVEARLGGVLQASGAARLPDLNSEVISLDEQHMLSFKPANDASHTQWTVVYLTAMGSAMTQLRWLEFFPDEQRAAKLQQQQQVRALFDQLIRRYAPECEVCKEEKARLK